MTAISVTKAKENIYKILSDVNSSSQPITITNNRGKMVFSYKKKLGMLSMYGRVTKVFPDRGYGFIRGDDNNTYFIHYSKLNGEQIAKGYYVYFKPFQNDRSDYNVRNVIVIEAPERRCKHGKVHK